VRDVALGENGIAAAPHIELTSRRWAEARDALGGSADNSKAIEVWAKVQ
jgi:hypothetical protein